MQIGPITLTRPIQRDYTDEKDNESEITKNEDNIVYSMGGTAPTTRNVKMRVPPHVYHQIKGISEWKSIYPIDLDNISVDEGGIKGYGFISKPELNSVLAEVVEISFDVHIIEQDPNTYLRMDYTNGTESGSIIPMSYSDTVNETLFTEAFDTFDTTNTWETEVVTNMASGDAQINSGRLQLYGASSADKTWGSVFTVNQNALPAPPFDIEFDMEWVRYATGYRHQLDIGLYPIKPTTGAEVGQNDYLKASLIVNPASAELRFDKRINGTPVNLTTPRILNSTTEKNPKIKLMVTTQGYVGAYIDTTGSGTYSKVWGFAHPGWDVSEGVYICLAFWNTSDVSESVYCSSISVTNQVNTTPKNVVCLPPSSTPLLVNDNHRHSEEGDVPYFVNPNTDLQFKTSFANFDKGSVKVYNNNNATTTYNRVFNDENVFTRDGWYATNGIIKLHTDSNDKVVFSYWNGTDYTALNSFSINNGTIDNVKPFYISPDMCIIKINNTYWYLFRGKQHVMVNHEGDDLYYTLKTCYEHDGTSTADPLTNTVISMQTNFYCNIWDHGIGTCLAPDPADDIRLQILQAKPTDIYSDKIPKTNITGIGWYDARITPATTYNGYLFNAREFFNIVETKIIL